MANSINQMSKDVCPKSAFTVKRHVPVDGVQIEVHMVPTCPAAEMARQNPAFLGSKFKECWLSSDGSTVREMLTPTEPTQSNKKFSQRQATSVAQAAFTDCVSATAAGGRGDRYRDGRAGWQAASELK